VQQTHHPVLGVYGDRLDITLKRMARATMDGSQRL